MARAGAGQRPAAQGVAIIWRLRVCLVSRPMPDAALVNGQLHVVPVHLLGCGSMGGELGLKCLPTLVVPADRGTHPERLNAGRDTACPTQAMRKESVREVREASSPGDDRGEKWSEAEPQGLVLCCHHGILVPLLALLLQLVGTPCATRRQREHGGPDGSPRYRDHAGALGRDTPRRRPFTGGVRQKRELRRRATPLVPPQGGLPTGGGLGVPPRPTAASTDPPGIPGRMLSDLRARRTASQNASDAPLGSVRSGLRRISPEPPLPSGNRCRDLQRQAGGVEGVGGRAGAQNPPADSGECVREGVRTGA